MLNNALSKAEGRQRKIKSEIRTSKSETNSEANKSQIRKIQNTESEGSTFKILTYFGHLNLFRILRRRSGQVSSFEFMVAWRALRLCSSHLFPLGAED